MLFNQSNLDIIFVMQYVIFRLCCYYFITNKKQKYNSFITVAVILYT